MHGRAAALLPVRLALRRGSRHDAARPAARRKARRPQAPSPSARVLTTTRHVRCGRCGWAGRSNSDRQPDSLNLPGLWAPNTRHRIAYSSSIAYEHRRLAPSLAPSMHRACSREATGVACDARPCCAMPCDAMPLVAAQARLRAPRRQPLEAARCGRLRASRLLSAEGRREGRARQAALAQACQSTAQHSPPQVPAEHTTTSSPQHSLPQAGNTPLPLRWCCDAWRSAGVLTRRLLPLPLTLLRRGAGSRRRGGRAWSTSAAPATRAGRAAIRMLLLMRPSRSPPLCCCMLLPGRCALARRPSLQVPALLHTGRPLLYVSRPGLRTFFEEASFVTPWAPWVPFVA